MAFIVDVYFVFNNFLIRHIPEIVFSLIAIIIILVEPYLIYLERAISSLIGGTRMKQQPSFFEAIRLDSFIVFILLIVVLLPLVKKYLMNYLEKLLISENLTFYLIVIFIGIYFYYLLVYRRHYSRN